MYGQCGLREGLGLHCDFEGDGLLEEDGLGDLELDAGG